MLLQHLESSHRPCTTAAPTPHLMFGACLKPCCSPSNMTRAVGTPRSLMASNITSAWLGGTTSSSNPCQAVAVQGGQVREPRRATIRGWAERWGWAAAQCRAAAAPAIPHAVSPWPAAAPRQCRTWKKAIGLLKEPRALMGDRSWYTALACSKRQKWREGSVSSMRGPWQRHAQLCGGARLRELTGCRNYLAASWSGQPPSNAIHAAQPPPTQNNPATYPPRDRAPPAHPGSDSRICGCP